MNLSYQQYKNDISPGSFKASHKPVKTVPFIWYDPLETKLKEIDRLTTLPENWDGYGGIPVQPIVAFNSKTFLKSIGNYYIEEITDIYPNSHGTITIEWEKNSNCKFSLEIGAKNYSYFILNKNNHPKLVNGEDLNNHNQSILQELDKLFRKKEALILL